MFIFDPFSTTSSTANVLVARGSVQPSRLKLKNRVFTRITFLYCFDFHDEGILTRKSATIGPGSFVKISKELEKHIYNVSIKNVFECTILRRSGENYSFDKDMDPKLCSPEKVEKSNFKLPGTVEISEKEPEAEDENENDEDTKTKPDPKGSLYSCPNNFCSADYIRYKNYLKHVRNGLCKIRLRDKSEMDHLKILWFNRFGIQGNSQLTKETSR